MSGVGEGGVNGQAWSGAEAMLRSLLADTEASQNMKGQMLRDTQRRAKRPLVDATKIQMTFFVCANENGKLGETEADIAATARMRDSKAKLKSVT